MTSPQVSGENGNAISLNVSHELSAVVPGSLDWAAMMSAPPTTDALNDIIDTRIDAGIVPRIIPNATLSSSIADPKLAAAPEAIATTGISAAQPLAAVVP